MSFKGLENSPLQAKKIDLRGRLDWYCAPSRLEKSPTETAFYFPIFPSKICGFCTPWRMTCINQSLPSWLENFGHYTGTLINRKSNFSVLSIVSKNTFTGSPSLFSPSGAPLQQRSKDKIHWKDLEHPIQKFALPHFQARYLPVKHSPVY